jgi:DNA-binding transcriptional ArsR family regulator
MSEPAPRQRQEREKALRLLDDHIGQHLRDSAASGELARAPSWGKPLDLGDAYERTPLEVRMAMKVLKDAGVVPPEVEMMQAAAALEARLAACEDEAQRRVLQRELSDKRQAIALRLEKLRLSGSL